MTRRDDTPGPAGSPRPPRSAASLLTVGVTALVAFVLLLGLGTWQVQRRAWKLDLIARVDARIHAAPTAAPAPAQWPAITRAIDEYRRVRVTGAFLNGEETLVQASTELGAGYWVMTPLRTRQGFIVLVNRGFTPPERSAPASRLAGQVSGPSAVTGLLRISEPGGGFLRGNDPASGRWYSRDVAAIAAARRLSGVAPYFIDADATPNAGGAPVGGLTVVRFPNSHLVYALTWYGLALLLAVMSVRAGRQEWRRRRTMTSPS